MPPSTHREYWRGRRKALQQLLWGMNAESSAGTMLVQALQQPLVHHVQQCVLQLLSLSGAIGEVGTGVG